MEPTSFTVTSACQAARLIREGVITSARLVDACLARVRAVDGDVQAWTFLDPASAMAQARAADAITKSGAPIGPLHGVPVGLKDIIDTADMPTENGSPLCAGRQPAFDAAVVSLLRAAGAVIMGKTVTTEFATRTPGKTRNPHDPAHTPGGSSSGSAAAVAAGMVPLALGSQTTGSTIRPASYCGVYGFKPTHGLIPRHGMWQLSRFMDHVGLFARSIDDVALLLEATARYDARDPDSTPRAAVSYREIAAAEPPLSPSFAFVRTPWWSKVDADAKDALEGLVDRLGGRIEEIELVGVSAEASAWHDAISGPEIALNLRREYEHARTGLSPALRERIERGRAVSGLDYLAARARVPALEAMFTELFARGYDAILTPAATGTAPRGTATGDPVFCALWTMCGMPALSVPMLHGAGGLPLGVQLVGARHADARLLRTARWLVEHVAELEP